MPHKARWLLTPGHGWQAGFEALVGPIAPLLNTSWNAVDASAWRGGAVGGLIIAIGHPAQAVGRSPAPTSARSGCGDEAAHHSNPWDRNAWPWVSPRSGKRPTWPTHSAVGPAQAPAGSAGPAYHRVLAPPSLRASPRSHPASPRDRTPDDASIAAPHPPSAGSSGPICTGGRLGSGGVASSWPGSSSRVSGRTTTTATTGSSLRVDSTSTSTSSSLYNFSSLSRRGFGSSCSSSSSRAAAAADPLGEPRVQPPAAAVSFPGSGSSGGSLGARRSHAAAAATAATAGDAGGEAATAAGPGGEEEEEEPNFVQVGRPLRTHTPASPAPKTAAAATAPGASPPRSAPLPSESPTAPLPSEPAAAAAAGEDAAGSLLERIPMLPASQRHQPPLPREASKQLWRTAEELAGAGRLLRLQVGKAGLSRALLARAGHLLEHHQLIRLALLQNCPMDVRFVAWVAENALDCVCVKVKGRTATLFRQKGLPRPPASFPEDPLGQPQPAAAAAAAAAAVAAAVRAAAAGASGAGISSSSSSSSSGGDGSSRCGEPHPRADVEEPGAVVAAVAAVAAGPGEAEVAQGGHAARQLEAHVGAQQPGMGAPWRAAGFAANHTKRPAGAPAAAAGGGGAGGPGYPAALAARFRKWSALRETRRLRLGVRRQ